MMFDKQVKEAKAMTESIDEEVAQFVEEIEAAEAKAESLHHIVQHAEALKQESELKLTRLQTEYASGAGEKQVEKPASPLETLQKKLQSVGMEAQALVHL